MKKNLGLLVLSLVITTQVFAQADVMQYPSYEPPKNGLGSKFLKLLNTPITKDGLIKGAKVASGFVVANKFKFIVGGVALSGVAGYNYLIQNPEKMGNFFSTHPELLDEFTRYVDYRIEHAQTQQEFDTFNNVKQQLALNIDQSQSVSLENDIVWQKLERIVENEIKVIDLDIVQRNRMPSFCNISMVAQILEPVDFFNAGIGSILPVIQDTPTSLFNVNNYLSLKKRYQSSTATIKLTPDHIPSYGALYEFFKMHGMSVPSIRRDSNLELNSSAITIPTEIHIKGSRTFAGRNRQKNENDDTVMKQDAQDLLIATKKDIITIAYRFETSPQYNINALDYIKSAMTLYERNKLLCMYDVK